MTPSDLPGVTIDAKDEEELAAAFGVTSNAEELVRQNQARYTVAHKTALKQPINDQLTETLYEGSPKPEDGEPRVLRHDQLEAAIGHPVEDAVVRGSGKSATISYVYMGPRGGYEKDIIPYAQVFGGEAKAARKSAASKPEGILQDAEEAVREELADAREEAAKIVEKAKEEIAKIKAEAEAEAQKLREKAAEEAVSAAESESSDDAGSESSKSSGKTSSNKTRAKARPS